MPATAFETAMPAIKGPQTRALAFTATRTGVKHVLFSQLSLGVARKEETLFQVLKQNTCSCV